MIRAALLLPLLVATAAPTGFRPGTWRTESAPKGATLDGKPLGDLPYSGGRGTIFICLRGSETGNPAAWLTRDFAPGCTVTRSSLAHGRVDIAATCPPSAPGLSGGTVRLTGRWTPTSYDLRFATINPAENGVMGFTGVMTGKWVPAACPSITAPINPPPRP